MEGKVGAGWLCCVSRVMEEGNGEVEGGNGRVRGRWLGSSLEMENRDLESGWHFLQ